MCGVERVLHPQLACKRSVSTGFTPVSGEFQMKKILAIALFAFVAATVVGCTAASSTTPVKPVSTAKTM